MEKRILVVDDEERIREVIRIILQKEDVFIEDASDGREALEKVKNNKYDLVILDIVMPGIDGIKVLEEIRSDENTSNLPVIILSAKSEDMDLMRGFQTGANYYITKPFEPQDLVSSVELILKIRYVKK